MRKQQTQFGSVYLVSEPTREAIKAARPSQIIKEAREQSKPKPKLSKYHQRLLEERNDILDTLDFLKTKPISTTDLELTIDQKEESPKSGEHFVKLPSLCFSRSSTP